MEDHEGLGGTFWKSMFVLSGCLCAILVGCGLAGYAYHRQQMKDYAILQNNFAECDHFVQLVTAGLNSGDIVVTADDPPPSR